MTGRSWFGACIGVTLLTVGMLAQQAPPAGPPPGGVPPGAPRAGGPPPQDGPKVVEVERLADNLQILKGGGGHSAVFVTQNNGVVVVDTKNPGWGTPLLAKIRELTDKPVTTVINSHVHGDHTSGNVEFPATTTFVAHANTKTNMERLELFQGANARFVPTRTFQDKLSLFTGPDRVDLYYFGRGGTDGDIWVVFPAHRTIFAGDAFSGRAVTAIDKRNGGNAAEFVQTLSRLVSEVKDVDTVVTGHGAVLRWADLVKFVQFNRDFQAWVRAQKQAGKTVDQAAAEYTHPAAYQEYDVRPPQFIRGYIQAVFDETN